MTPSRLGVLVADRLRRCDRHASPGAIRPVVLPIAGSDPSGAAGVQAGLKIFHAFETYGAAVVSALTVHDTTTVHVSTVLAIELTQPA